MRQNKTGKETGTGKKRNPEEHKQEKQRPVKVLTTDKSDTRRNPLHSDLSEKPEKENKAVREQDVDDKE